MVPFKVKCIDTYGTYGSLHHGAIYTVVDKDRDLYTLHGVGQKWFAHRFVVLPQEHKQEEKSDIKAELLADAGNIVTGARRAAYGKPENNFGRIAKFWQAYLENCGLKIIWDGDGAEYKLSAKDVSPMMRLMKEARLCETPDHRDSFTDIIGYTLTGAEVNGVK